MPRTRLTVRVDEAVFAVEIDDAAGGGLDVRVDGQPVTVDARLPASGAGGSLLVDGAAHVVDVEDGGDALHVLVDGTAFAVRVGDPARRRGGPGGAGGAGGGERVTAPMPGKVVAVLVTAGQAVAPGAGLVVLEAMKMENELRAARGGTVAEVRVDVGQTVNAGDLLVAIE